MKNKKNSQTIGEFKQEQEKQYIIYAKMVVYAIYFAILLFNYVVILPKLHTWEGSAALIKIAIGATYIYALYEFVRVLFNKDSDEHKKKLTYKVVFYCANAVTCFYYVTQMQNWYNLIPFIAFLIMTFCAFVVYRKL
ncbi:MAG: hypothetical protein LBL47_02195 [Lactobacillus sp.]|jgi:TRAP-type uncharacterized transport system fused permease subunit|nr:hypothetical protein [Lactobacillus sp.]